MSTDALFVAPSATAVAPTDAPSSPTSFKTQLPSFKDPELSAASSPTHVLSPTHHATETSRHSTPATSTVESVESNELPHRSGPKLEPSAPSTTEAASSSTYEPAPLPDADDSPSLASIKPAYFYPIDAHSSGQDGVPVFEPTMEQFQDFYAFCQAIDRWGMQAGIVKVVPPKEWRDALPDLRPSTSHQKLDDSSEDDLADISKVRIRNAIVQHFTPAGSGVWRQTNITRTVKTWNAKKWADTCISEDQKGPEMDRMKWKAEVDGASNGGWGPKTIGVKDEAHPSLLDDDGVRTRSGKARPSATTVDAKAGNKRKRMQRPSPSPSSPTSASRQLPRSTETSPTKGKKAAEAPEDWRDFDYKHCWLKEGLAQDQIARLDSSTTTGDAVPTSSSSEKEGDTSKNDKALRLPCPSDWNQETCREIESEYWRGLNFGKPPMYGADLKGSLFDKRTKDWNVEHLDNVLTRLKLRRKLPGVNTPYLYWGMWRATFAWHVEDMDLYSINYIHFGAPKQWYSIRQADRQRFESAMAGAFPTDSHRCPHFMRHKSYLASPSFLASHGIRPLKLVHNAGEFVITYPYGYHSGFNLGYNCAESVNFALESWLDIGRKANYCHCDQSQNSVIIDVDAMLEESKEMEELERKRELRRSKDEPCTTFEEEEVERRRVKNEKAKERRKLKKEVDEPETATGHSLPFKGGSDFYIDSKDAGNSPCVFCPADVRADMVPTPAQVPTDNSRLQRMAGRHAHRLCASFIPETWVGQQGKSDMVCGIEGIDKARFALKCQICPNANLQKLYPKIQCTRGKCPRSAHVSCALVEDHGWFVDLCANEVADRLEGKKAGTKVKANGDVDDDRLVVLCRAHNPLFREAEEARKAEELRLRITALPVPSMIKIKTPGGTYEAMMVEVRETEDEVVIEDEERPSTVKFQNILFEKPAASSDETESATKGEPLQRELLSNKRTRRASRKAVDIAAAVAAEKADDDANLSSSPVLSVQPAEAADKVDTMPASVQPRLQKKVTKPKAPRTGKAKTTATEAHAGVNGACASTLPSDGDKSFMRDVRAKYEVPNPAPPHQQMQHQYQGPHMPSHPFHQPQQQFQQRPHYLQASHDAASAPYQSAYGTRFQGQDAAARFLHPHSASTAAMHASSRANGDYTPSHYSSPEYSARHSAYPGYAGQSRASATEPGAGYQHGHPAAPYHDAVIRAPALPTYAKPLPHQLEHRYGTLLPEQAMSAPQHGYASGHAGHAGPKPYAYAPYQQPYAQVHHQAQPYHHSSQYAGHARPHYEYEQPSPAHLMPAHYAPSGQIGHYQRP